MPDITLSEAIKEAYAAAPANLIIYHTLELWHSAFTAPIRVVRDYQDLTATLEAGAPRNPGASVTFVAFAFDFTKPEITSTGLPEVTITIDNVDRSIVANIEAALTTAELIQVIYREFISTDLTAPQNDPPLTLSISSISATLMTVTARAGFMNLMNKRFPTIEYNPELFVGLSS